MILTWLLHAVFSTVIAFLLANIFGALTLWISIVSLLLGTLIGWRCAKSLIGNHADWKFRAFGVTDSGMIEIVLAIFVGYAALRHFMWLLFPMEHHLATLSLNNFGDLPLHINFTRALANGITFPPRNPIFASELLHYPYGVDLYSALLEQIGIRLQAHLLAVGLLGTAASIVFLRSYAGWVGIGAFFLSGGLSGWEVIGGARLRDFSQNVDWKNLFLSVFITQRGVLFALPIGLLLIIATRRHFSGEAVLRRGQMIALGIIWGFLPLFHLHAFVAVSLLMAASCFEVGGWRAVVSFLGCWMSRVAYLPAALLVLFSTRFLKSSSVLRLRWGWMAKSGELLHFLTFNFGAWLFMPIFIAAALYLSKDRFAAAERKKLWIEFAIYLLLFLVFFNLMLAPWEWDNIKLLIWPYLGFARLLYILFDKREGSWLGSFERPLLAFAFFYSGFATVVWTLLSPTGHAVPLYATGELAKVEGALSGVSKNAVFASAQSHLHPLTYFGGIRVAGYEGHLWSHGIDHTDVVAKLDRIMHGDPESVALCRELGVTHIFWGPDEKSQYGDGDLPWMHVLQNVSRVPEYAIYAIKY